MEKLEKNKGAFTHPIQMKMTLDVTQNYTPPKDGQSGFHASCGCDTTPVAVIVTQKQ